MSKVIVMYETGRVWSCDVDAVGDGDAGEICAASGAVELIGGTLVYEPQVMPWKSGQWRSPTGIVDEWTNSSQGFIDMRGGRHELRGDTSMFSERGTVEESYAHKRYVLLTASQLEDAVSVTVDGVLAYTAEGGALVPVVGGDAGSGDEGMVDDFAALNHPIGQETAAGMSHVKTGIRYENELW